MADTVTVAAAHSDAEVRREAAQMLGTLPARQLPRLTAGRLALLDLIGSPLLEAGLVPTRMDAVRALYVVDVGPLAVAPVAMALRREEELERAAAQAARSPELYREWLAALATAAEGWADFDQEALAWLDASGIGDLAEAFGLLAQAFEDAVRGFALVPREPGADPAPFADGSGRSGSPVSTPAPEIRGG